MQAHKYIQVAFSHLNPKEISKMMVPYMFFCPESVVQHWNCQNFNRGKVILCEAGIRLIYYVLSLLYNNLKETTLPVTSFKCICFKTAHDEWKGKSRGTWNKGNQSFCISWEKFQIRKAVVLVP